MVNLSHKKLIAARAIMNCVWSQLKQKTWSGGGGGWKSSTVQNNRTFMENKLKCSQKSLETVYQLQHECTNEVIETLMNLDDSEDHLRYTEHLKEEVDFYSDN